jgi:hypothetical protein
VLVDGSGVLVVAVVAAVLRVEAGLLLTPAPLLVLAAGFALPNIWPSTTAL